MNYGGRIIEDMKRLVALFLPHCSESDTLQELHRMLDDRELWQRANELFDRIRMKALSAEASRDRRLAAHHFEEVCAKTLYNLSASAAHFDADSPYWIIPTAFALARVLVVDDSAILDVVTG